MHALTLHAVGAPSILVHDILVHVLRTMHVHHEGSRCSLDAVSGSWSCGADYGWGGHERVMVVGHEPKFFDL